MPIGFWAISRQEVKEMIQARTGANPSNSYLDKVVGQLINRLERSLDTELECVAKGIADEKTTLA